MSDNSRIEWTDATWNPVTGCTKVSPGCDHCYAERVTERFHGPGSFANIQLHPDRLDQPLRWRRPRMVFVNSMSDLFHDAVPDEFIVKVFDIMGNADWHTFQVLTKRHARMRSLVAKYVSGGFGEPGRGGCGPLRNVWLGVSVENQKWADIRIPALLETPAAVRWISAEPLLGPVELETSHCPTHDFPGGFCTFSCPERQGLDWVVVGGESGPGARPMDPNWARSLRDQCVQASIPFFFKQFGEWAPNGWRGIGNANPARQRLVGPPLDDMGHREVIERVGKRAAGRELDARTWDEYPAGVR